MRNPRSCPPEPPGEDDESQTGPLRDRPADGTPSTVEPIHLPPLLPRRHPWLVVEVDGSSPAQGALVWALREAARREATVLAVTVPGGPSRHALVGGPAPTREQAAALHLLEAQVLRAIAETGVHGRVRTAVLERPVLEALSDAALGADLVIVGTTGKTVLRPAVARHPVRRLPRGA